MSQAQSTHTPGPWRVVGAAIVSDSEGVADVRFHRANTTPIPTAMANARLIAAAPDMLQALQSAVESFEQLVKLDRIPANMKGLRDARATITLATQR